GRTGRGPGLGDGVAVTEQPPVHRQHDRRAGFGLGNLTQSRHGRTLRGPARPATRSLIVDWRPGAVCNEPTAREDAMAGTGKTNTEVGVGGINQLGLVWRDMAETVAWYEDVLGMKLVKTLELPDGRGQHFFLDMGNGVDAVAFFWFPDAPDGVPGESIQ